jgi:cytochrome c553
LIGCLPSPVSRERPRNIDPLVFYSRNDGPQVGLSRLPEGAAQNRRKNDGTGQRARDKGRVVLCVMRDPAKQLTDAEIDALAAYYGSNK